LLTNIKMPDLLLSESQFYNLPSWTFYCSFLLQPIGDRICFALRLSCIIGLLL